MRRLWVGAFGIEVVGHSTFTLTLNTYGDWIPDDAGGWID